MRKRGSLIVKIAIAIILTFVGLYLVQVDHEVSKTILKTTTFSSITGDSVLVEWFNETTDPESPIRIKNITFYPGRFTDTKYLYLRKNLNVTNATLNLTGHLGYYANESFMVNSTFPPPLGGGLAFNGTHFFILGKTAPSRIIIHNITGGYFGSLNLTGVDIGNFDDIWMNDTTIFALNNSGSGTISVYQFNLSGNLTTNYNKTGMGFKAPANSRQGAGIATNGSIMWAVGQNPNLLAGGEHIHIMYTNGTLLSPFKLAQSDGRGSPTGAPSKDVEFNGTFLWVLDNSTIHKYFQDGVLPQNPYIDVGNDGSAEWNFSGNFSQHNNKTENLASAINNYLSTCAADAEGNCTVPIVFTSSTTGILEYSGISIDSNDTTPPTVTINLASSSIPLGASTTISCSASDNIEVISLSMSVDGASCSGVNSCSLTYQGGSSGSKSISCSASDSNTNGATATSTLSVTDGSGGGGGGGGSGGGTTEPPTEEPPAETPPAEEPPVEEQPLEIPQELIIPQVIQVPLDYISASIAQNTANVDLGGKAQIIYYIGSKTEKPRLDITFKPFDINIIKKPLNIKFTDYPYYAISFLTILLVMLLIITTVEKARILIKRKL